MTDKYIFGINGIISRTVTSNNLIVAIKNFDNTDFSSSNPLVHKIGDTPRTLTSSLSVTVTAGTSTFNAGSNELKTLEQDYFVYLGWRASDSSIFIIISRIPYAKTYGDFSATATNEKYGAYSGAAPASTDAVVNIGRFNATNSGSASYNWSVPATSIVINYPIFETRWLSWTPTYTGFSANPGSNDYKYKIENQRIAIFFCQNADGTSNSTSFAITIPFNYGGSYAFISPVGQARDNSGIVSTLAVFQLAAGGKTMNFYTTPAGGAWTATNGKSIYSLEVFLPI